ncbi:MAG: hypothetical protein FIA96_12785 [Betaproteobacteria bacterium]|nr:hypothetical protein [Betaproteobacteria bacterium]
MFRAMGNVGNEFIYHSLRIAGLALGIGSAILLMGANATALIVGLSCGSAAAAIVYLIHNQRKLALRTGALFSGILLPGFAAYPLAAALLLVWQASLPAAFGRWETLAVLSLFGITYSALWSVITWHQLRAGERQRVRALLVRFANSVSNSLLKLFPKWRIT